MIGNSQIYKKEIMMKEKMILAINPGSTSTKISVFKENDPIFEETLRHSSDEINSYESILAQYSFRKNVILESLKNNEVNLCEMSAVVGRGGLLRPISGGTYSVNKEMISTLESGHYGEHASNLGAVIAFEIAENLGIPAFIVDPVVVDELSDLARISGMPEIERRSIFHALNQKAVARRAAEQLCKDYNDCNFIVCHMGGGISVGAHEKGRVIDVNNALDGDGPFSPERSGSLPVGELSRLCFSGEIEFSEIKKKIKGKGGLVAYLDSNDGREVSEMIDSGNGKALLVYRAMAYQIGKEIGMCGAVLKGRVDSIILTGGLAFDKRLTGWISEMVSFIAPVRIFPGEDEMSALASGALRVLNGEEDAKNY